jgi:asparagine synthase (glutamine-hydrolysing)
MLTYGGGASAWRGQVKHDMELMVRRGPDASGIWSDDDCCVLGFRRLSILDLSAAANQPMLTRDGRYALVYNGELYNFREIRKTLQDRGVSFRSTGDAEVVLNALALDGVTALNSFNGMFALALYDTLERRLLLARDHAAIKPLYVLWHKDGLLFASGYDQIVQHPWARGHDISPGALGLYLNLGYIPPPFALLGASAALEAGTWMSVDVDRRTREGRYFTFPRAPVPDLHGPNALEALNAAIESAVRRQMISDVPIGVFLSGGIDSPLVAAKMRQANSAPIPAFTLGTNGDAHDESPDARRYAKALGLRHVVQHIAPADVLDLLDDVVSAYSEPHDDYSIFPTTVISRIAREHVTVVLSGDGGDDVFWGYPDRMIRPLTGPPGASGAGTDQFRAHRFLNPRRLATVFPSLPELPSDFTLYDFEGTGVDELAEWLRWNEFSGHLGRVLQKVDRASMHHSLEVRVPLLDREVLDVATRMDWRSCVDLRHGVGKLPLRALLERHVGFQTMRKRGFTVPMSSWLRGPLRPVFEDLVLSRHELLGLPMDRNALRRIFRRHLMRLEGSPWLLWRLLSLALWETRHFRPVPAHA